MDIYIRSQDKKSICKIRSKLEAREYSYAFRIFHEYDEVGSYDTMERCVEIIDEICRMARLNEKDFIIYNMPKE